MFLHLHRGNESKKSLFQPSQNCNSRRFAFLSQGFSHPHPKSNRIFKILKNYEKFTSIWFFQLSEFPTFRRQKSTCQCKRFSKTMESLFAWNSCKSSRPYFWNIVHPKLCMKTKPKPLCQKHGAFSGKGSFNTMHTQPFRTLKLQFFLY